MATPGQLCPWYPHKATEQSRADREKYAFAECLVWQTTRCLVPEWNFSRLVTYTQRYTDPIQKFVMGSWRYLLFTTYLPTAYTVLHKYEKSLHRIVTYQTTIGFQPLELLVFGSFMGLYCARLHLHGIKEAPDYAVIAVANALKFFDDTGQFHDTDDPNDGWRRLDTFARYLIGVPVDVADELVWTCKTGERIQRVLSEHVQGPIPVPVWKQSGKRQDTAASQKHRPSASNPISRRC